jgi:hypothetical protein
LVVWGVGSGPNGGLSDTGRPAEEATEDAGAEDEKALPPPDDETVDIAEPGTATAADVADDDEEERPWMSTRRLSVASSGASNGVPLLMN